MPLAVITEEQNKAAFEAASSDIKWLMAEHEVDLQVQAVLYHNKFRTKAMIVGLGESRAEVKETLAEYLGLDDKTLDVRRQIASVLAAWEACKQMITREVAAVADAKAANLPRPVGTTEHQAMRAAYESRWLHTGNKLKS